MTLTQRVVWEVDVEDGGIQVERAGDLLRINWLCGDEFLFTPEEAEGVIEHVRIAKGSDVSLSLADHEGNRFGVRRVDKGVFGTSSASFSEDPSAGSLVPWRDLRKAVQAVIREIRDLQ